MELVPPAAHHFQAFPLTIAGKIHLSLYHNDAILHAETLISRRQSHKVAFSLLCKHAQEWCLKKGVPINHTAQEILKTAYEIPTDAPLFIKKERTAPDAYKPYTAQPRKLPPEDIYVSYFKIQEHYHKTGNPLDIPNPYREKFIQEIETACAEGGEPAECGESAVSKTEMKNIVYKLYLDRKEDGDV